MCVRFCLLLVMFLLVACGGMPQKMSSNAIMPTLPTHQDSRFNHDTQPNPALYNDACALLADRPHWRMALAEVKQRWHLDPWYILAFLHQESRFSPTVMSPSKAYGYAQVKDESWDWYELKTGNTNGKRDRFDDAVDFIGFFATKNKERNGTALHDVKNQYLAYHEGMGGFERGSYLAKPWLLKVSDKVVDQAALYQAQLLECPIR